MTPPSPASETRHCGACSACCTVLRVDELSKLGGSPCPELGPDGTGCSIHARRPRICRDYRCLWLAGGLDEADRPDRLGAVLDVVSVGIQPELRITETSPGRFDASSRLQEIAGEYRRCMPVRIAGATGVLDTDQLVRRLLPDGIEEQVRGDRIRTLRGGQVVGEARLSWLSRLLHRGLLAGRRWRLRHHR